MSYTMQNNLLVAVARKALEEVKDKSPWEAYDVLFDALQAIARAEAEQEAQEPPMPYCSVVDTDLAQGESIINISLPVGTELYASTATARNAVREECAEVCDLWNATPGNSLAAAIRELKEPE